MPTSTPSEADLAPAIAAFIAAEDPRDEAFDAVARQLFGYQYVNNLPYRRYCDLLGVTPDNIAHWTQIPAAPAAAFKEHSLTCVPPEAAQCVFHSSGTTGRAASRHYLSAHALALYNQSLRAGFNRFVLPDGARLPLWALVPPPQEAPHSSLSYMIRSLMDADPRSSHRFFWRHDGPDTTALAAALRSCAEPVILFGTAFAWVLFFDACPDVFRLPPGTRVLETGGFKGRTREIPADELYSLFTHRLGVPPSHCLAEYGMSEMCSQAYDSTLVDALAGRCLPRRKLGPPWLRTRVIDPRTGTDAAPGETGILCHYDLANLNSVLAIETEDLGARLLDGFQLRGRVPRSELRGCSLTAEEWHARRR
ncbi:MAG: long-chain fatty acid--CoA ligase [Armatimonadota bacterium]|nr:long-chain fatty acid--CoA ligase [Armatimonadota bacterium]